MTQKFADILQGLMNNRGLSPRTVSWASARAESTILQLVHGSLPPSPEIVADIAPVLQISEADLLVIAGLAPSATQGPFRRGYRNSKEIGEMVAIASSLSDERFRRLIELARGLRMEDRR